MAAEIEGSAGGRKPICNRIFPVHLKTLKQTDTGWEYSIDTMKGVTSGSEIDTKEDAIKHAERELGRIIKRMLKL